MPSIRRPGKRGLYVELPEEMDRQLRLRCERTGAKISDEVRTAIGRHLAYPPAEMIYPPLPDSQAKKTSKKKTKMP